MNTESIETRLNEFCLSKYEAIDMLRKIGYEYVQYKLEESIREEANVNPDLPNILHCIHAIIKLIEE